MAQTAYAPIDALIRLPPRPLEIQQKPTVTGVHHGVSHA